jgi:hypothetical protein
MRKQRRTYHNQERTFKKNQLQYEPIPSVNKRVSPISFAAILQISLQAKQRNTEVRTQVENQQRGREGERKRGRGRERGVSRMCRIPQPHREGG